MRVLRFFDSLFGSSKYFGLPIVGEHGSMLEVFPLNRCHNILIGKEKAEPLMTLPFNG
jgi:hypothetical protein